MEYYFRNLTVVPYNREKAVAYAHMWAYGRNHRYYDFEKLGGDCTNFASQVLYEGCGVMNYTPVYGWYYRNANDRTPSWTGVNFLYRFLVTNKGPGPFAVEADIRDVEIGDIIQLSFLGGGVYNHSPVVVQTGSPPSLGNILVAAHTFDRDYYPITNYSWRELRVLHILGARKYY